MRFAVVAVALVLLVFSCPVLAQDSGDDSGSGDNSTSTDSSTVSAPGDPTDATTSDDTDNSAVGDDSTAAAAPDRAAAPSPAATAPVLQAAPPQNRGPALEDGTGLPRTWIAGTWTGTIPDAGNAMYPVTLHIQQTAGHLTGTMDIELGEQTLDGTISDSGISITTKSDYGKAYIFTGPVPDAFATMQIQVDYYRGDFSHITFTRK